MRELDRLAKDLAIFDRGEPRPRWTIQRSGHHYRHQPGSGSGASGGDQYEVSSRPPRYTRRHAVHRKLQNPRSKNLAHCLIIHLVKVDVESIEQALCHMTFDSPIAGF
ncbi:hypothetical protein MPL3356_340088 [Mesorhizobium plurifarium]|uniref:Uncharacterized protein n=1 Tax=Mesorhizobium plurifarium TaxID=69974 RepID=A0A090E1H1_MESPL|nr:hypothetical protein MPL3356_340088 [Mesorhizobium plurifarium]